MKLQTEKAIIFDASTIISFAMACLFDEFKRLKQSFNGKFLITQDVKEEIVDKPMAVKKFKLEAIKIQKMIDDKILELPDSVGIGDKEIKNRTEEFESLANNAFSDNRGKLKLIDDGESSCLALSKLLTEKNIENVIAVDERTTRMLCENPEGLRKFLEKKFHTKIYTNKRDFELFKNLRIIRSTELIYIAYKKGLVDSKDKKLLDALLYAIKFKGCSISDEEIEEIERL